MRRSLNSDANTNTDGVKSLVEKHVYTEGTFAEQGEIGRITKESNDPLYDPYLELEPIPKHYSLGSVSFGAQNNMVFFNENSLCEKEDGREHATSNHSVVSIRDI